MGHPLESRSADFTCALVQAFVGTASGAGAESKHICSQMRKHQVRSKGCMTLKPAQAARYEHLDTSYLHDKRYSNGLLCHWQ